ncbi:hypothetical protein [Rhodococcoides corynebacterioides]|uniref:hypothetical protein n=1 Tax=Rhodococcoides corynebacterioides TaxID=53972 RepID=UPI001C9AA634|nr:hypothetical protein [Rhodococcus corynebacterioides]MBY6361528.1 hypothetical protein [Rhodococcus corynebacterioides]
MASDVVGATEVPDAESSGAGVLPEQPTTLATDRTTTAAMRVDRDTGRFAPTKPMSGVFEATSDGHTTGLSRQCLRRRLICSDDISANRRRVGVVRLVSELRSPPQWHSSNVNDEFLTSRHPKTSDRTDAAGDIVAGAGIRHELARARGRRRCRPSRRCGLCISLADTDEVAVLVGVRRVTVYPEVETLGDRQALVRPVKLPFQGVSLQMAGSLTTVLGRVT